jgi:hypothetical protein
MWSVDFIAFPVCAAIHIPALPLRKGAWPEVQ